MEVCVKPRFPALEGKEYGDSNEGPEDCRAGFLAGIKVPVKIQFEGIPGGLCLRDKHREEKEHKDYGTKKHHCPNEAKVPECRCFHEEKAQECAYGGDIACKKGLYLLGKRFPSVWLILKVIHVMERVINRYPYYRAAYPKDNDGYAGTEQSNYSKGENGAERYGNEYPQNILEAFVAEPKHNAYKKRCNGQGQERIFLDAAGVLYGNLRTARGIDMD